jgi:hypothetical protein
MAAGTAHVIEGVDLFTTKVVVALELLYEAVSVGVNVAESVCGPTPRTVPAVGE